MRSGFWVLAVLAAIGGTPLVAAADGLYVAAGIGQSTIRNDDVRFSSPVPQAYDFDQHATAWKIAVGDRFSREFGAELEYLDLGHPTVTGTIGYLPLLANDSERAFALFGIGHLPLPIPLLDIYGKFGVAAVRNETAATNVGHNFCSSGNLCIPVAWTPGTYHQDDTTADLAYGAGIKLNLAPWAIGVEYERLHHVGGDSDVLSFETAFTF